MRAFLLKKATLLMDPMTRDDDALLEAIAEELLRGEKYIESECMDPEGECTEGHLYECPVSSAFAMWKSAIKNRMRL